jgi:hypothetical protein
VTATLFVLTTLDTGRSPGAGLICLDARYASVAWRGVDRVDRRFASPAVWRSVEAELTPGFDAGPLEKTSGIWRLLTGGRSDVVVQYLCAEPFDATPTVSAQLDARLRAV